MPVVVVHDGEPVTDALHLESVTLDELKEGARNQGIADLGEIRLGVLEPDGRFSFITHRSGEGTHRPTETHKT